MKTFMYKGIEFKPKRKLEGLESDFFRMIERCKYIRGLTPEGWDYDEFYDLVQDTLSIWGRKCDIFEIVNIPEYKGMEFIPASGELFRYV